MLKIRRVAAAMPAQDIKRARQFYEQKIGLTPTEETPDGGVMYVIGETGFSVFPTTGKSSGDHTQLMFDVDDFDGTVRELKHAGIKLEEYDFPNFKTRDGIVDMPDGNKAAWFKDSEGNLVEIWHAGPG